MSALSEALTGAGDAVATGLRDVASGLRDGLSYLGDSIYRGAREIGASIEQLSVRITGLEEAIKRDRKPPRAATSGKAPR